MKKTVQILSLVMAALMCAVCFVSCGKAGKNYAADNTKLVIGMSGPLTGGAAIYGVAVKQAAQLAVDELNAAGGIEGMQIDFRSYDDQHDPTKVASGYASLYEGGMQISLGTVTTKPGLEFVPIAAADNVFFITPSASGDDIPVESNGYQLCFADSNQGTAAAIYVNANYADKTIGVLYNSSDAYSTGILKKFENSLDPAIKANLTKASFDSDNVTDLSSQIGILKDCQFIFMPIYYTPASLFMKQALDVTNSIEIYYGCDGLDGIDSIEGFDIKTIPQEVSMLTHFNSSAAEGPAKLFIDKYKEKYGEAPNQFAASAYDCVYAIAAALKNAKADGKEFDVTTSPSDYCEILKEQFGKLTFTGVTGEYKDGVQSSMSWDAKGYVNKTATKVVIKENTK